MTADIGRGFVTWALWFVEPLEAAASSPEAAASLIAISGWDVTGLAGLQPADLSAVCAPAVDAAARVRDLLVQTGDITGTTVAQVGALLADVAETAAAVRKLADDWSPPAGLPAQIAVDLAEDLLGALAVVAVTRLHPLVRALFDLTGVLTYENPGTVKGTGGKALRGATPRARLDLAALGDLVTRPGPALAHRFGLDPADSRTADQVADDVFPAVAELLRAIGLDSLYGASPALSTKLSRAEAAMLEHTLRINWVHLTSPASGTPGASAMQALEVGLRLRDTADGRALAVALTGGLSATVLRDTWSFRASIAGASQGFVVDSSGVTTTTTLPVLTLAVQQEGTGTLAQLGAAGGPSVVISRALASMSLDLSDATPDLTVVLSLGRVAVGTSPGGSDGFISKLLPSGGIDADTTVAVEWSRGTGLRFQGGAGLEVSIPAVVSLGPLRITGTRMRLAAGDSGPEARITTSFATTLGPFSATLSDLGLRLDTSTPSGPSPTTGVHLGIQPPTGAGIAIDAAAVKGGGFLLFDEDAGRYAGVFELTLLDTISVKAIAIVNTRNPDGTPGFALLVMITAEGFAPVPLGMGFTLTGIGGLLAINHTFDAKAITDGLRSGVLDSILFVKDPVKNISRVLGTLDKVFPIAQDRLVVGPLAEISWGTPTMVRIRLALVLELPQPVRVALLAAITVQLPDPKVPVVDLHIDAAGILDLGRRTFALDASLHDSKIAGFTLTGDMSLRLGWGDDPGFLASFGGFHPKFKPPPDVRPLQRLALSLTSSDNPRVRFEAYLAVTSNTLQLGARADVHAEAAGLALDAGGSFDALLQLVPFSLDVAFAAWARISAGGATLLAISISVDVTGPAPWHITGQATISILFISATVGIDLTVGEAPAVPPVLESVDVGDAIWSQLGDPARWEAALPAATRPGAILLSGGASSDGAPLVAHPLSRITARQQAAPLDHRVDCVGARVPARGSRTYTAAVGTTTGVTSTAVQDQFAPAQFQKLTQDQQLTAPSFVPMNSGVALTPAEESASGPRLSWDFALQTLDVTSLDEPASPGPAVAATDATARGPVDPAADLAQTVTVAAS